MADAIFAKKIYFVRHGETDANVTNVNQGAESPLSQKGHQQAEFIAARVSKLTVEALIVSTMVRTRETAEYISKSIGLSAEFSDLFIEYMPPSELIGLHRYAPEVERIRQLRFEHADDPDWHYSDEENMFDLKARAIKALEMLANRPEKEILVVTHGYFMRVLLAIAIFGQDANMAEIRNFIRTCHMENTSLSVFGYDPSQSISPWWLWVWNDHAHLG